MSSIIRQQINVSGIVQGIGFRPYIYRLAKRLALDGYVVNNSNGVLIEIQGAEGDTRFFLDILTNQPPPLAQITEIIHQQVPLLHQTGFTIRESEAGVQKTALISPDIATCPDCLEEMTNPANRRFQYPFINCTNCGPRFTIISNIPYDRPHTSMASFTMCQDCLAEYKNPDDRRFHAQPNACEVCGPKVGLISGGRSVNDDVAVQNAVNDLEKGKIVAIKGIGGFHLAVDATNTEAVENLRKRKKRFEKPLALMAKDMDIMHKYARINRLEANLIRSLQRPIVLCSKKNNSDLSYAVSPDNEFYGLMLPYTPLHHLLFESSKLEILVMTSANISEEPICYENEECLHRMDQIADSFLIHNRDIYIRCDDSVVRVDDNSKVYLRRSRGYAPRPIVLQHSGDSVLAVGGHLKNTVCITRDKFAYMSQHIGDLENMETLQVFEKTIDHLKRIFEIEPRGIVHDLHPDYLSTRWVQENTQIPSYAIQHHYAHILSVMAEHGIREDVLGFSLDGTGYGEDGSIWGGEILLCNHTDFRRIAHFDNVPLPGGEAAVREPWRMAVAYIHKYLLNDSGLILQLFPHRSDKIRLVLKMIERDLNTPQTSSCGRLFDAVAAILGLKEEVAYEGQAAVVLESLANQKLNKIPSLAPFNLIEQENKKIITANEMMANIVQLKIKGVDPAGISLAFHQALVDVLLRLAVWVRSAYGLEKICLSGGCFQNKILRSQLAGQLRRKKFKVYTNLEVPPNDGGIALGQAYWGMLNSHR